MPSGSHGGSHGGSHFSSSSHSSSHSSSYTSRPLYFSRGRYYLDTNKSNKLVGKGSLAFFTIFFVIAFLVTGFVSKSKISQIKEDRDRYLKMIEKAENNSAYLREGTVTGFHLNEDYDKYYFTYKIPLEDTPGYLYGYSYTLYENSDHTTYTEGTTLDFAIDTLIVSKITDSIDLGYKYLSLEDDAEYCSYYTQAKIFPYIGIGFSVLEVIQIFSIISYIRKNKEEVTASTVVNNNLNMNEVNTSSYNDVNKEDKSSNKIRCDYCGEEISKYAIKCPHCGVKLESKRRS